MKHLCALLLGLSLFAFIGCPSSTTPPPAKPAAPSGPSVATGTTAAEPAADTAE